jgi:peptidoglycan hydrolase-like protein with peptidoglycan-binding domain
LRRADKTIWRSLVLIVSAWLLVPANLGAAAEVKASGADKAAGKSTASASTSKKSAKKPTRSYRRRRRSSFKTRIARMKLQPDRVSEIQQSLIDAGYLHQEPSGKWDSATRDAMLRYQTENGFAATGLPEAKSLMKLGLGPHPLPADVDPTFQAQARSSTSPEDPEDADDAPSEAPASEVAPH